VALTGPDDEAVLQAARVWLKGAGGGLTDDQVIVLDSDGGRPELPYLAVGVFADRPGAGGVSVPGAIDALDVNLDPTRSITMRRAATVTVQAHGRAAFRWVQEADLRLGLDSVIAALAAAGVVIVPGGSGSPAVIDRGTDREDRAVYDFEARYRVATTPEVLTAADEVALTLELRHRDEDPDPLTVTTSIDLT